MIEALKDNVFYQNRKEISAICAEKRVDVSIGNMIFIERNKDSLGDYDEDYKEWRQWITEYEKSDNHYVSELFE